MLMIWWFPACPLKIPPVQLLFAKFPSAATLTNSIMLNVCLLEIQLCPEKTDLPEVAQIDMKAYYKKI